MMKPKIDIIGLGAGDLDQLSIGIYKKLQDTKKPVFIRTLDHPLVADLEKEGVTFKSFDAIYESHQQFGDVYVQIAAELSQSAKDDGEIIYAVPGHPMLAEQTVQLLLENDELDVSILGGQSFLDDLFRVLRIDPIDGFQFVDATSFNRNGLNYQQHLIFCQVYDSFIASEVKLSLLEDLPPEHPVTVVCAVGSEKESIETIPLVELDHYSKVSNLTSVYVPPVQEEQLNHQFFRLKEVISVLRGPNGCPWDKKQTHASLKKYLIEEAYELLEAIDLEDDEKIIEELGDVLLQVMLHSQIGEDAGFFTVDDVINTVTEKMIRRHPHVFGDVKAEDEDTVMKNWQAIKQEEKPETNTSVMQDIPLDSPALLLAEAIQKRAKKVGFDWDEVEGVWDKIAEELAEVKEAAIQGDHAEMEAELGDVLFAIVNLTSYYKVNPEIALTRTNQKFLRRFKYLENRVAESDRSFEEYKLEELDVWWEEAKEEE